MLERQLPMWIAATIFLLTTTLIAQAYRQAYRIHSSLPNWVVPRGVPEGLVQEPTAPSISTSEGLTLMVVGESSAVGVGVELQEYGLAAQIARELSRRSGQPVRWCAHGKIGATVKDIHAELLPEIRTAPVDIIVVAVGVNDTAHFSSPVHWYRQLRLLLRTLRERHQCHLIALSPVPPLWKFRALPQPLRALVGTHAFILDRVSRQVALTEPDTVYVPVPFGDQNELLCDDCFHPSRNGYQAWAAGMADVLAARVQSAANAESGVSA